MLGKTTLEEVVAQIETKANLNLPAQFVTKLEAIGEDGECIALELRREEGLCGDGFSAVLDYNLFHNQSIIATVGGEDTATVSTPPHPPYPPLLK